MVLDSYKLNEVSDMLHGGTINRDEAVAYVRTWNRSRKHFTVAVVYSFSIGLFDPGIPGKLESMRDHAVENGFEYLYE